MTRLSNSFDGGTDGVTITTGNSGGSSGTAFDDVTAGGAGTITYDAANALFGGLFSGKAAALNPAVSSTAYLGYTSLGTLTTVWGRAYVKFPVLPAVNQVIALGRDSGTSSNCCSLVVQSDGKIGLRDSANAVVGTSTSVLTAGSYARLEWRFVGHVSAGVVEVKIFLSPYSTTASETVTATAVNTRGSFDRFRIGQTATTATDLGVFYVDEIGWDDTAYMGPSTPIAHTHFLQTGQSLSIGGQANSNLTTVDPYPGILVTPTSTPAFQDAVEPIPGADWESGGVSFLKALYEHVLGTTTWSIKTSGHAATPYIGLKKGTTYYNNSITFLGHAQNAASALGRPFTCGGVLIVHGENDMAIGTTRAQYLAFLEEWQSDYETDIKASTGQTGTVPAILTQVATWNNYGLSGPTTGLAMLDAHRNNPGQIIMAGPKYHLAYSSPGLHLTSEGYYDLGEYHAKVAKAIEDGTPWEPVAPVLITISGTVITCRFSVPVEPLVFDTTTIPAMTNMGFSYTDDGGTTAISSVSLANANTVTINLNASPGANPRLRYGFSTTDYSTMQGGGGNLRDSDTYVGGRGSRVLQNWCCHFEDPIPFVYTSGFVVPGLLDATPQLFTPKVNRKVSVVATIDVTPTLFVPQPGSTSFAQTISFSTGAFQQNAFDDVAFDYGVGQLTDMSPTLYAPSVGSSGTQVVYIPAPVDTVTAFQTDAFDDETFQQLAAGAGITHIPSLNAPSVSGTVAAGQFVYLTSGGGWDSPLVLWDDPNHTWDEGNIGGIVLQQPQLFTPTVKEQVTVPLLDATPQLFTPTVAPKQLVMPLISVIPALFDHRVNMLVFLADVLDASPVVFEFQIQAPIQPGLIDHTPELFTPTVNPQTVEMVFIILHEPALFDHRVNMSVLPELLDATPTLYAPAVGPVITPGLIDHTPEVYTPSLERIFVDLIDIGVEVFEPAKVNIPINTVVNFEFIDLVDHSPELFDIVSIELAPPQFVIGQFIDGTPIVMGPHIITPTRPTIILRARYDPVTVLRARYDPVTVLHAQNTRQGA